MRRGPGRGFAANFLRLSCARDIEADYFAFCDQDDIWEPDKLRRALAWLTQIDPRTPALYCSRTHLIDEHGNTVGYSPLFSKAPHFRNAIVQSIAGGNTMVFNAAARELLVKAGRDVDVPSHDWWLYILVTAMGGAVRYDCHPTVRYRVHNANAVGANHSLRARLTRIWLLLNGNLRTWTDKHVAALLPLLPDISPEGKRILLDFLNARRANAFRRLLHIYVLKIYRQTAMGNIGLFFAFLLRKA
jgi:glycosyltransferase involved in cell wall biosynthesis